jgi:multiple sugar transport system substrate-binding protein
MKYIFAIALACLVLASVGTWIAKPEIQTGKRVVYWVTDPNPVRQGQVDAFHAWMQDNVPVEDHFELRVDAANTDITKKIVQSVSGVGGELMDLGTDGGDIQYFQQIGIAKDVTAAAATMDFGVDKTYRAIAPALQVDGRQYAFPCNVYCSMYWVNLDALERHGIELPSRDWTWEEFETLSKQFSERANEGLQHRTFFLTNRVELMTLIRNRGLDLMNETLTASTLDSPVLIEELERLHRWTYDDRILPSKADLASISTEAAHGGAAPQMFRMGNYGMFLTGRWALCQMRLFDDFDQLRLAVLPPPDGGFQNTSAGSRAAVLNAGSKHPDLALYFLQFLASPAYSQTIVDSADAMPPIPAMTETEDFKRPPGFTNEWGCHEVFSWGLNELGVPVSHSPFISTKITRRELGDAEEAVMAVPSLRTAAEAASRAQRRINERIESNLLENPELRPAYAAALQRQTEIDRRKAAGEKIPRALITNTFHELYYEAQGMLE